jgi:DNA-binding GntR family transcriptional regulator
MQRLVRYRSVMPAGDSDQPLYARIASDLRRQIDAQELAPGARLPSEASLAERWGTTRPTVRQALELLEREGLLLTRPGAGRYVRPQPPAVRVRSVGHYRRAREGESTSPFARDAHREGARPDWTWETVRLAADARVAERLGIEVGDYVMRTTYLFRADGRPVQSSISWEPHALVGGTPIEEPEGEGRVVGVIARMDSIGVRVDRVVERVQARPPTDAERARLEIPDRVWVQEIERTHWVGDRAVETCDICIPADRYRLEYEILVP